MEGSGRESMRHSPGKRSVTIGAIRDGVLLSIVDAGDAPTMGTCSCESDAVLAAFETDHSLLMQRDRRR